MGRRGPRPTPTAILKLRGSRRAGRLGAVEPPPSRPRRPSSLSPGAARAWNQIVPGLAAVGILAAVDATALVLLCESIALWQTATAEMNRIGLIINADGRIRRNPYLLIASRAGDQMAKMLAEFGMTPSSRSRVQARAEPARGAFESWDRNHGENA